MKKIFVILASFLICTSSIAQKKLRADSLLYRILYTPDLNKYFTDSSFTYAMITDFLDTTSIIFKNGKQIELYTFRSKNKMNDPGAEPRGIALPE